MEQDYRRRIRFIRLPRVEDKTGLSRSTIYARIAAGEFPKPVSLGSRAVGWIEREVDDWIMARIAARRMGDPDDKTMDIR